MAKARNLSFKTEVRQLLDLMINSLYSNRDIFLRELISNASDALDRLRFLSLSDEKLIAEDSDLRVEIVPNKENNTLTIYDNGIGMDEEEVIANIGTIASSGTKKFLDSMEGKDAKSSSLIGQFGVGFYSAFMVANKVELLSRRADKDATQGVRWKSSGEGKFSVETVECTRRGTQITLSLRDDASEYIDLFKLKSLVHRYSEHLNFPVRLPEKEDDASLEMVNKAEALWTKSARLIEDSDYKEFYKMVAADWKDPLLWMHSHVEGKFEYTSLLYFPEKAPFDLYERERKQGIKLYVKRVFIMEDTGSLLPNYMRFVRGVVDCPDIKLNVSREILQQSPLIRTIRAALVKRVLDRLKKLASDDSEKFATFTAEFGKVLKEGVVEDSANKEKIAELLRFRSLDYNDLSLTQYVENMIENQDRIYYLCAESQAAARSNPHLDIFKERKIDVLLMTDKIDEWVVSHLREFKDKKLQAANDADLVLPGEKEASEEKGEKEDEAHKELLDGIREALGDTVRKVEVSQRLRNYPACITSDSGQYSHHMQQLLKQMGQDMEEIRPVLQINPEHALIQHMSANRNDERFNEWSRLLLDQALLAEGAQLGDPGAFVERLNLLLTQLVK